MESVRIIAQEQYFNEIYLTLYVPPTILLSTSLLVVALTVSETFGKEIGKMLYLSL